MSNTRVFDYNQVSDIYNQMNQIIGDNSDPSSIAGLLYKIDENYHEVVNGPAAEDVLALRGDLAKQLLNNWENTAGSFPAFVENFSTWSTLVAQAAGDYKVFEETVRGIRTDNPLGWNTGGIQQGYVSSSNYTNAKSDAELDQLAQGAQFYDLVGAYYVDTGMVSYAKKAAFWNGFGDVLSVVAIVASGCSLVKGLGAVGSAAKGASAGAGLIDDGAKAGAGLIDDGANAGIRAGTGLIDDGAKIAGESVDDLIASGKPIANSSLYGLTDDAATATDRLISQGYTLVDDTWQLPANMAGAPTAANSAFNTMGQSVDDLIAGGKPIANSSLYGLTDDAAAATDRLISQGYTLVDDTWQLPANMAGAPTAANSAFNTMSQSVDDLIAGGKPISNSAIYGLSDESASLATDKLIAKGYTLVDDTWQLPASANGAPSLSSGSAFGQIVDDTPVNYIDEAINAGKTMGTDGSFTTPASAFKGAPSRASTSAMTGDLSKTVSKDSITALDKGLYYGREGAARVGDAVKNAGTAVRNGLSNAGTTVRNGISNAGTAVKNGLSNAGTAVKSGLSNAGTAVKNGLSTVKGGLSTAGTWVKENGVTVLKETATNLGTSGLVGQGANIGQNAVNNANIKRNAEMVANARAHFGNNGN